VPGSIGDETGAVILSPADGADRYGVVDEISRRAPPAGARVLALRRDEIPGQGSVAAILRYRI